MNNNNNEFNNELDARMFKKTGGYLIVISILTVLFLAWAAPAGIGPIAFFGMPIMGLWLFYTDMYNTLRESEEKQLKKEWAGIRNFRLK